MSCWDLNFTFHLNHSEISTINSPPTLPPSSGTGSTTSQGRLVNSNACYPSAQQLNPFYADATSTKVAGNSSLNDPTSTQWAAAATEPISEVLLHEPVIFTLNLYCLNLFHFPRSRRRFIRYDKSPSEGDNHQDNIGNYSVFAKCLSRPTASGKGLEIVSIIMQPWYSSATVLAARNIRLMRRIASITPAPLLKHQVIHFLRRS